VQGDLKNIVFAKKPRTLQDLKDEIETASAAAPPVTMSEVRHPVARLCQQLSGV
jgi:hypothetical protein